MSEKDVQNEAKSKEAEAMMPPVGRDYQLMTFPVIPY